MATNFDPIGSEVQVNLDPADLQFNPDVAVATDGRFMVAFAHEFGPNDDDIHLQFLNTDGTLSGSEIIVDFDGGIQRDPAVASRLGGSAVVVWEDDLASDSIELRLVNADGSLPGGQLTVADFDEGLFDPDAAMLANGQVVVVYERDFPGSGAAIFLRVLNADGTTFATADSVAVDNPANVELESPAIAASGNNALIVYEDTSGDNGAIQARLYDGNSGTVGGLITIGNIGDLNNADVAALADGRYIVVWDDELTNDIQGRFVDANGNALGAAFTISSIAGNSEDARVAALRDGGFIVTYENNGGVIPPETANDFAVLAQRFDSSGAAVGDVFLVNTGDPTTFQGDPAVAANPLTGQTFIAWEDDQFFPGADPGGGVRGRAFIPTTDIVNGTAGDDLIKTFSLGEEINGLDGDDVIFSFAGNDLVHGNSGGDGISGGLGDDQLFGDSGADRLFGEDGHDLLVGGRGKDKLAGGLGEDRFDFNVLNESVKGSGRDLISAFSHAEHDRIDLKTIDAKTTVGGNQAFKFIGSQDFGDIAGQLRFAGGLLQADVNGDGIVDFEIKITGSTALVNADLVL